MHEIKSHQVIVGGVNVETWKREIKNGSSQIEVEVGTTGPKAKIGSFGTQNSRFFLRIAEYGDSYLDPSIHTNLEGTPTSFVVSAYGDSELRTLYEALGFARKVLKDQMGGKKHV